MSSVKVFKKGDVLYKEGEKAQSVFLIQSGAVALQLTRLKAKIEICTLGAQQIVGEHAISGVATHPHTAVCTVETKAIELPLEAVKAQFEQGTQLMKFMSKGLTDKLKVVMRELQAARIERDPSPCPMDQTAKIFGSLYHVSRTKGEDKDGAIRVSFQMMKQYAQRIFLESPKRLEMATNIFVKLGCAKYQMVKDENDPDGPEEIGYVTFTDLPLVEEFFEFYQYYYFKGGKTELLKTDDRVVSITQALIEIGSGEKHDRHGAVRIDYSKVIERIKDITGIQISSDHFALLEKKGLLVKRQSSDDGVFLHFDFKEFTRTARVWKVLREVERWNEVGYVDPNEPVNDPKKAKAQNQASCSGCGHGFEAIPKFCPECGQKLAGAAAA